MVQSGWRDACVLWEIHTNLVEAFEREFDRRAPEHRSLKRDIKLHEDCCQILLNLAKQREAKVDAWSGQTMEAFNNWTQVTHELLTRLQHDDLLVVTPVWRLERAKLIGTMAGSVLQEAVTQPHST